MVLAHKINPLVRAVAVIASVVALATGVTFAALQDSVTLQNNTIASANADLSIWDGDSWEATAPGFTVTNQIPGNWSGPNYFYLKNNGSGNLKISATVPGVPAEPGGGYDFSGWDNLKVQFQSYDPACGSQFVNTNMQQLMAGQVDLACNPMAAGVQGDSSITVAGNYSVRFMIEAGAVTGDSPGVGNFDIVLTGTAQ